MVMVDVKQGSFVDLRPTSLYDDAGVQRVRIDANGDLILIGNINLAVGPTPATGGTIRLTNNTSIAWRNAGNTVNLSMAINGSNQFVLPNADTLPGADAANDLGAAATRFQRMFTSHAFVVYNTGGNPAAVADRVAMGCADIAAGDARLAIQSESGSVIHIGGDTIRFGATIAAEAGTTVVFGANNQLAPLLSSETLKEHWRPLDSLIESRLIYGLNVQAFDWNGERGIGRSADFGLGAETVARVHPLLANYAMDGVPESIAWHRVQLLMLAEIQSHERQIAELKALLGAGL